MNETRLNSACLSEASEILSPPRYDRGPAPKIVHFGCGAFHRAHQAVYFDQLMRLGEGDWMIQGVSLKSETALRQLNPQDGLYTLVEQDGEGSNARIIGSIQGVINPQLDPGVLVRLLASPSMQLVTLTVTEKGYHIDPTSGAVQLDDLEIRADIACPDTPFTAPGYIVAGLAARRAANLPAFTVLSCDNLSNNGGKMRDAVIALAEQTDAELADWIANEAAFPSSMVDRITPSVTDEAIAQLKGQTGYHDEAMVQTEPFHQWIVEDWFSGERPPLEKAGVQMTSDVEAWEAIKLRLLNGAHSSLAYVSGLLGHEFVHGAARDADVMDFVDALWDELEATLPEIEGFDPAQYRASLLQRFANSALDHRLRQIAIDGSQKLPQRLIQPLKERLRAGQPSPAIELAIACWTRWQMGHDFAGNAHEVEDARAEIYTSIVRDSESDFEGIVRKVFATGLFGEVVPETESLIGRLAANLAALSGSDAHYQCRRLLREIA